ncbi:hypothetical protein ACF0H5_022966 [Mactra antiquata]
MAESSRKLCFRVAKAKDEKCPHLIAYKSYDEFLHKCKMKLNIPEQASVRLMAFEDNSQMIVDQDSIEMVENKALIVIQIVNHQNEVCSNVTQDLTGSTVTELKDTHHVHVEREASVDTTNNVDAETMETSSDAMTNSVHLEDTKVKEEINVTLYERVTGSDFDVSDRAHVASGSDELRNTMRSIGPETSEGNEETENTCGNWTECFIAKEVEELSNSIKNDPTMKAGERYLQDRLNDWKKAPVHIAVTGLYNKGKSSFINTFREVKQHHKSYAKVSVIEETKKANPYPHTKYKNIVLWDLPSYGSDTNNEIEYAEKYELKKYDIFILCVNDVYSPDKHIAVFLDNKITRKQPVYIVRTKIDQVLGLAREEKGDSYHKENTIDLIRGSLQKSLPFGQIFLINNFDRHGYDFPEFVERLISDVSSEKQRILVRCIFLVSKAQLDKRVACLSNDIWKNAFYLSLSFKQKTLFKVGSVKFSVPLDGLLDIAKEYWNCFQFPEEDVAIFQDETSWPKNIQDFIVGGLKTEEDIREFLNTESNIEMAMNQRPDSSILRTLEKIPISEFNIASFKVIGFTLQAIIEEYKTRAVEALDYINRKVSKV